MANSSFYLITDNNCTIKVYIVPRYRSASTKLTKLTKLTRFIQHLVKEVLLLSKVNYLSSSKAEVDKL